MWNDRSAVAEADGELAEAMTANPYHYPEFAGTRGESYLRELLRQILPLALYRTWEILMEQQGENRPGYLGVMNLAKLAQRTPRTLQKNLDVLGARGLMTQRAERRVLRTRGGRVVSRTVVVKDFGPLYDLAHEYHEWLDDERYVPAERELVDIWRGNERVVAKVRRFENYRRVLMHRRPGPQAREREDDRWFREYLPEEGEGEDDIVEDAEDEGMQEAGRDMKILLVKEVPGEAPGRMTGEMTRQVAGEATEQMVRETTRRAVREVPERIPERPGERINASARELPKVDERIKDRETYNSSRSSAQFPARQWRGETPGSAGEEGTDQSPLSLSPKRWRANLPEGRAEHRPAFPSSQSGWETRPGGDTSGTALPPSSSHPGGPVTRRQQQETREPTGGHSPIPEQATTERSSEDCQDRRASRQTQNWKSQEDVGHAAISQPRVAPPDSPLVRTFMREIATPFGEREPEASVTRVLRVIAEQGLQEVGVLCCLVRAYAVVRDTQRVRPEYRDPTAGQMNHMPLFCKVFERFAQACVQGKAGWDYTMQQLEEDVAVDDRLRLWWYRYQKSREQARSSATSESPGQEEQEEQKQEDPEAGWTTEKQVRHWAQYLQWKLRGWNLTMEVRICREEPWYYLLVVGDGMKTELWTYAQTFELLASLQKAAAVAGAQIPESDASEEWMPAGPGARTAGVGEQQERRR
jgi:hypothetical protein